MNFKKFMSIGLLNALLLLLVAMMIASCQKKSISETGLFTSYQDSVKRLPASVAATTETLSINSRQIYIYCQASSVKVQSCYNHHFSQKISEYIKENSQISAAKVIEIRQEHSFHKIQKEVKAIEVSILEELHADTNNIVAGRLLFCKNFAQKYPQRCMLQYTQRDSMKLLNNYQQSHKGINAHEYIYLKKLIQKDLEPKLESAANSITI